MVDLKMIVVSASIHSNNSRCFADFSEQRIMSLLNDELADNLGNMLNRVTGIKINPSQTYPSFYLDHFPLGGPPQGRVTVEDYKLLNTLSTLTDEVTDLYDDFKFGIGITKIMECVQLVCCKPSPINPYHTHVHT